MIAGPDVWCATLPVARPIVGDVMTLRHSCARLFSLALIVILAGCAARQAELAKLGRSELVGLSERDIRMCAGLPAKDQNGKDEKIWMYEHNATSPGGVEPPALPWIGQVGHVDAYCRVQVRFVRGKVAEVSYAGASDIAGASDAACGPIIKACLTYPARRVAGR
jgi:hypothetical protein